MTRKCDVKGRRGFTLMELMVVLLIIGILSSVALRTIDATQNRAKFDQTTKAMSQLVQAMVGNPNLTYDGRRVDFGFFGDMERLPQDPHELVIRPNTGDAAYWHGPYLHLTAGGDTASYLYDGWGNLYSFNLTTSGTIESGGNGKYPMTMSVGDSLWQLFDNTISGTITDADNNPPGTTNMTSCTLRLYYNNPVAHGGISYLAVTPDAGGYYQFADTVPAGIHKLVATIPGDTLTRYVTSEPRSHTIVDLKFTKSFWNKLVMVGPAQVGDTNQFYINIANDQTEDVTINYLIFKSIAPAVYMRDFGIDSHDPATGYPLGSGANGKGPGDTVSFPSTTVPANLSLEVPVMFRDFRVGPADTSASANVHNKYFDLLFSDGSEIKFTVP